MRRYTDLSHKPIFPKARFLPRGGNVTFPKDKFLFDKIEKNGLNTGLFQFYQPDIIW